MSLQFMLWLIAVPLASSLAIGLVLLRKATRPAPVETPAPKPEAGQPLQPVLTVRQDDPVVAELAGLLRRHLDMLPQNYDAVPAWDRLVEDTVRVLIRNKLTPIARLAAEQQATTLH